MGMMVRVGVTNMPTGTRMTFEDRKSIAAHVGMAPHTEPVCLNSML
jgi:hypothetical protein